MSKKLGIVWLRQDFRLLRNNALSHATNNHDLVNAIFIFKDSDFKDKREAQRWWIYNSVKNFRKELNNYNINLEFVISKSYQKTLEDMSQDNSASFYWNKIYEPKYLKFDEKISKLFNEKNIEHKIFKGNTLNEYNEVKKSDNTPFKVFTPFWRNSEHIYVKKEFSKKMLIKKRLKKINISKSQDKLEKILPLKPWFKKFEKYWTPCEKEALKVCNNFVKSQIKNYSDNRDVPGIEGTSKLSPYLALGQIHVETIWEKCEEIKVKNQGYRKFINELGWREFSHSLINYFPEMLTGNLRKEFDRFPWVENKKYLKSWKEGKTGYPIVDAGMRELSETGWMHNRVRMITASFLVKHLRINWKEGEKHFRDCLLDFNEANNVSGWQWVSGCGADAAPYFRIFNPILQGEKFDKAGSYVKKWVPELLNVSQEYIHKPWEVPSEINNFKIGKDYPMPIVDHRNARESALSAFQKIKK